MELLPINCLIIGIGERSAIVNKTLYDSISETEKEKKEFLSLDYHRGEYTLKNLKINNNSEKVFRKEIVYHLDNLFFNKAVRTKQTTSNQDSLRVQKEQELRNFLDFINNISSVMNRADKFFNDILRELDSNFATQYNIYHLIDSQTTSEKMPTENKNETFFHFSIDSFNILKNKIGQSIEKLSKYDSFAQERNLRIVVHTYFNQDHPKGLYESQLMFFDANTQNYSQNKEQIKRVHFSRNMFFLVMEILRYYSKHRGINIDVYPVILFRTNIEKQILYERDHLYASFLAYLYKFAAHKNDENDSWLKTTFLLQDINNWNDPFTLHEQITLLYLNILILSDIGDLTKQLNLDNNLFFRNNILSNIISETLLEQNKFCFHYLKNYLLQKYYKEKNNEKNSKIESFFQEEEPYLRQYAKIVSKPVFTTLGVITNSFPFRTLRSLLHNGLLREAISLILTQPPVTNLSEEIEDDNLISSEKEIIRNFITNGMAKSVDCSMKHITLDEFKQDYAPINHIKKKNFDQENIIEGHNFKTLKDQFIAASQWKSISYRQRAQKLQAVIDQTVSYYTAFPEVFQNTFLNNCLYRLQEDCFRENKDRISLLNDFCAAFSSLELSDSSAEAEFKKLLDRTKQTEIKNNTNDKNHPQTMFEVIQKIKHSRNAWQKLKDILENSKKILQISLIPALKKQYQEAISKSSSLVWHDPKSIKNEMMPIVEKVAALPPKKGRFIFIALFWCVLGFVFSPKIFMGIVYVLKEKFTSLYSNLLSLIGSKPILQVDIITVEIWDILYWGVISLLIFLTYLLFDKYYQNKYKRYCRDLQNFIENQLEKPAEEIFKRIIEQNIIKNILRFFTEYYEQICHISRYYVVLEKTLYDSRARLTAIDSLNSNYSNQNETKNDYTELNRKFFKDLKLHAKEQDNKIFVNMIGNNVLYIFNDIKNFLYQHNNKYIRFILRYLMLNHKNYTREPNELIAELEQNEFLFADLIDKEFDILKNNALQNQTTSLDFKKFIPLNLQNQNIQSEIRHEIKYELITNNSDNHFLQLFYTAEKLSLNDLAHLFYPTKEMKENKINSANIQIGN